MTPAVREGEHRTLPLPLGLFLALVAGSAMPLQGRINGALGEELGSGIGAAVVSFGVGLLVLTVVILVLPVGRRGLREMPGHVRAGRFPWWYMLAGAFGAFFVLSQGLVVTFLGVALFTVANVAGQIGSGLLVDRIGFGPGGPRPVSTARLVGALLALAGVVWVVWPTLAERGVAFAVVGPMLMPLVAGLLMGFQQAMNGVQTRHYGNPLPATFFNFLIGTIALVATYLVMLPFAGPAGDLPSVWWMYIGGPLGIVFIAAGAVLVRLLGVLVVSLGLIAGQLLGSLAIDALAPVPGSTVSATTVLGTLVALVAVVIAAAPRSGLKFR
ncbi:DMT family transporter [Zhihengliuella salsuginis]|uniref:Membrane protein n=1 Tax=Zhihengliuella salsuginis TaxID=578222 RepID=A0ABQ3GIG2_9MICC|nr:DMT family transporter [Zhihengliuella salsuginis]GHD07793.1 membrane protein [Zhihengliuella salsuginis]